MGRGLGGRRVKRECHSLSEWFDGTCENSTVEVVFPGGILLIQKLPVMASSGSLLLEFFHRDVLCLSA